MKKNALLTFIFACIPGAGQMYYGYMQRGLSLITLFCGCFVLGALASPLLVTTFIVWMYSFFDTYDLIRHLASGDPKSDGLMILGDWEDLKRLIPKHNRLLGWGLIALGIWSLYGLLVEPVLYDLLAALNIENAYYYISSIPTILIAALLIAVGVWLLGLHPQHNQNSDLPPYPHDEDGQ